MDKSTRLASLVGNLSKMNPYDPEIVRVINRIAQEVGLNADMPQQMPAVVSEEQEEQEEQGGWTAEEEQEEQGGWTAEEECGPMAGESYPPGSPMPPQAPSADPQLSADDIVGMIQNLHNASVTPAQNYKKVASITAGLMQAAELSRRPQYSAMVPRIASIVQKLAGIFAEVDLAEDLASHTLEQIEQAVHKLYNSGAMNKPATYNFKARGKGFHS